MTIVPRLRSPIVLVHGLLGFDNLRVAGRKVFRYFPGIAPQLEASGNRVLTARLCPTGGVVQRAGELREFIERAAPGEPVHVIAHSMGGLDARYMISRLGMAKRVLSLTTVGTPHRGSSFAAWGLARFERLLRPVFRFCRWPSQAFYDLTPAACAAFNRAVPDMPNVDYYSVAGVCEGVWLGPEWAVPHRIVARAEGPNDGVVSSASASWGAGCEVWEGDHLNLVNWPNSRARCRGLWRDRGGHYAGLVRRLADAGY